MYNSGELTKAITEWTKALGPDCVLYETNDIKPYENNTCGIERKIPVIIKPSSTEEVKTAIEIANEFGTPVYPFSKGKQWGLGSRLPVTDETVCVDLSRMNKIHEVNVKHAYAVIEPGVTQGQFYQHLKKNNIPLIMDVTGSGLDSSIIGNALDRGVGYFTDRGEEMSGLKVVLGNGRVIETGFGHFPGAKTTYLFKHGVGAYLDGLFFQSNYGVVTRAGINLMSESDDYATFICKIKNEKDLPELVEKLAKLKKMNIVNSVAHVGNHERTKITLSPLIYENLKERYPGKSEDYLKDKTEELFGAGGFGPWSATGRLFGTKGIVGEYKKEIRKAMKGLGSVMFLTDFFVSAAGALSTPFKFIPYVKRKKILLESMKPIYNFTKGVPTDDAVKSVYWPLGDFSWLDQKQSLDPDQSQCGVYYYCPITPLDGEDAKSVSLVTNSVLREYGFVPSITMNTVNKRALETVISIPFSKKNPSKVTKARESMRQLHKELTSKGIYPYRVSIDLMDEIVDDKNPFWITLGEIKESLDPNNIISPKRYSIF